MHRAVKNWPQDSSTRRLLQVRSPDFWSETCMIYRKVTPPFTTWSGESGLTVRYILHFLSILPKLELFVNVADILHASVLGNHLLILNSLEDAQELLEKTCKYLFGTDQSCQL